MRGGAKSSVRNRRAPREERRPHPDDATNTTAVVQLRRVAMAPLVAASSPADARSSTVLWLCLVAGLAVWEASEWPPVRAAAAREAATAEVALALAGALAAAPLTAAAQKEIAAADAPLGARGSSAGEQGCSAGEQGCSAG